MKKTRGAVSAFALAITLALAAVVIVALRARGSQLSFEERSLDRVCSRWAAESGLALLSSHLATGHRPEKLRGDLPAAAPFSEARYRVTTKNSGLTVEAEIEGVCVSKSGRPSLLTLSVALAPGKGGYKVKRWQEGPKAP